MSGLVQLTFESPPWKLTDFTWCTICMQKCLDKLCNCEVTIIVYPPSTLHCSSILCMFQIVVFSPKQRRVSYTGHVRVRRRMKESWNSYSRKSEFFVLYSMSLMYHMVWCGPFCRKSLVAWSDFSCFCASWIICITGRGVHKALLQMYVHTCTYMHTQGMWSVLN